MRRYYPTATLPKSLTSPALMLACRFAILETDFFVLAPANRRDLGFAAETNSALQRSPRK
jgi:hypothetical protein